METGKRTAVKALVWQFMGLFSMSIIGFAYTGSLSAGGSLALLNTIVGLVLYVSYERIWSKISWGRQAGAHHDIDMH